MNATPRVLHVNDCAATTTTLVSEARRQGLAWRYLPIASTEEDWQGVSGLLQKAARGAKWEARLGAATWSADLVHLHSGMVHRHAGWLPRPMVLHLHGTDIRSQQYDPRSAGVITRALAAAQVVVYSTPDLAEHTLPRRPDALLMPVPIAAAALPRHQPAPQPTVVFASRWERVKGLDVQLALANELGARHGPSVRLAGLDWGEGAELARAAGVELVPMLPRARFHRFLASAHVVVGQPTGMLAASELEAMGIGVPVVAALKPRWYDAEGLPLATPPVRGGLDIGREVRLPSQTSPDTPATDHALLVERLALEVDRALAEQGATDLREMEFVAREHNPAYLVASLQAIYQAIARRRGFTGGRTT